MSKEDAATQMTNEIVAVIDRYSSESDVTVYETIGALEVVKMELLEALANMPRNEGGQV